MSAIWKWHCIKVVTARATQIEADLEDAHTPVFFPVTRERVIVGKERLWRERPRLGQYAFAQINHDPEEMEKTRNQFVFAQMSTIKAVRGVVGILVNQDGKPEPIRAKQIDAIRSDIARERAEQDLPPSRRRVVSGWLPETPVRIIRGPFESFRGRFVMAEGQGMALVEIDLFGQATAAHLPDCDIVLADDVESNRGIPGRA